MSKKDINLKNDNQENNSEIIPSEISPENFLVIRQLQNEPNVFWRRTIYLIAIVILCLFLYSLNATLDIFIACKAVVRSHIDHRRLSNTGMFIEETGNAERHDLSRYKDLYMDIIVENKDIGFIGKDIPVKYKIDSFPYIHYGLLSGKIISISLSAAEIEDHEFIYHIKGNIHQPWFDKRGEKHFIEPGMTATAIMITEEKSIFSLFFKKIRDE